jgi:hypothetical protein
VRATGGGAFKFAELFRERLGVVIKKEDEISCLVQGCNFLLRAIRNEAFEFCNGEYAFKHTTGALGITDLCSAEPAVAACVRAAPLYRCPAQRLRATCCPSLQCSPGCGCAAERLVHVLIGKRCQGVRTAV